MIGSEEVRVTGMIGVHYHSKYGNSLSIVVVVVLVGAVGVSETWVV